MSKKVIRILLFVILVPLVIYGGKEMLSLQRTERSEQSASTQAEGSGIDIASASSPTVIVNKHRPLQPAGYVPKALAAPAVPLRLSASSEEMQLAVPARESLEKLFQAAEGQGVKLKLASGYRSYYAQEKLYSFYVSKQGQAAADRESARAGHSEHQTGLAADVSPASGKCSVELCFAGLPEGKWVAAHAHEFGFVIRYPEGKEAITGYAYEPWHLRFVGTDLAAKLQQSGGQTLEDYFKLGAAPDYNKPAPR